MTVQELIEELQKYPSDMTVVTKGNDPFSNMGDCLDELRTVKKSLAGYVTTGDDGRLTIKRGEVVVIGFWHGY